MSTKKKTAANCKLIANTKRIANKPIFKKVSQLVNEQGEDAALAYLGTIFKNTAEFTA